MKKLIVLLLIMLLLISAFSGCTVQEADKVNHNMNVAADNFNC